jgi:cytoskeletal protein RodZ
MAKFPPDRFDNVPESRARVGAHRSGAVRHTGWIVFAWAALACGVLVGVGVLVLNLTVSGNGFHDNSTSAASAPATSTPSATSSSTPGSTSTPSASSTPSSTPTPTDTPLTDPSQIDSSVTRITVLNSTTRAGIAANAATTLRNGGWTVASQGNAASTSAPTSIVYYDASAADNRSIALGIAQKLGITTAQQSTAFPNSTITVVLGADYVLK